MIILREDTVAVLASDNISFRQTGDISVACSKEKFESMKPFKPDMIITNCPGCPMFLDRWQYVINEMEGTRYGQNGEGIPVFTYEEVAGLVLGYDPWDLGLQMHQMIVNLCLTKWESNIRLKISIILEPISAFSKNHSLIKCMNTNE